MLTIILRLKFCQELSALSFWKSMGGVKAFTSMGPAATRSHQLPRMNSTSKTPTTWKLRLQAGVFSRKLKLITLHWTQCLTPSISRYMPQPRSRKWSKLSKKRTGIKSLSIWPNQLLWTKGLEKKFWRKWTNVSKNTYKKIRKKNSSKKECSKSEKAWSKKKTFFQANLQNCEKMSLTW